MKIEVYYVTAVPATVTASYTNVEPPRVEVAKFFSSLDATKHGAALSTKQWMDVEVEKREEDASAQHAAHFAESDWENSPIMPHDDSEPS